MQIKNPQEAVETPKVPFPWVTAFLIGGSMLVAASELVLRRQADGPSLPLIWGFLSRDLVRERQWWRLLSYAFIHGGPLHLGMNMLAAYNLGLPLERRLGSARFAEISLITCLGAAAAVVLFADPKTPTIGASGILFGWLGLLVPLLSREALRSFARVLVLNALISLLPGISWQGHLGGFLAGLACGLVLRFDAKRFSVVAPALVGAFGFLAVWAAYRLR